MNVNEVDISFRKIRTFTEEQGRKIDQLRRILDTLESCYRTGNHGKMVACHNQMIQSVRNNYQNNQEYNNFIQYMSNNYKKIKQKNIQTIERIEGNIK